MFNPVFATYQLGHIATERVTRTLSAWSVTNNVTVAALTAAWGVLATLTSPRAAVAIAGVVILTTPLLLRRRDRGSALDQELALVAATESLSRRPSAS